ncbi:MAG: hypothetical protein IJK81_04745 [Selenomonadaceae bacterium]|nr:hypothetical protein [Selenomonadaceae bacterium]
MLLLLFDENGNEVTPEDANEGFGFIMMYTGKDPMTATDDNDYTTYTTTGLKISNVTHTDNENKSISIENVTFNSDYNRSLLSILDEKISFGYEINVSGGTFTSDDESVTEGYHMFLILGSEGTFNGVMILTKSAGAVYLAGRNDISEEITGDNSQAATTANTLLQNLTLTDNIELNNTIASDVAINLNGKTINFQCNRRTQGHGRHIHH